jgi:hypothetical protein
LDGLARVRSLCSCIFLAALLNSGIHVASADVTPLQIHTVAGGGTCSGSMITGGKCDEILAAPLPVPTTVPAGGVAVPQAPAGVPPSVASGPASPIGTARFVAALPSGGFLYVDLGNNLIREVSPLGIVTTVAGNGTAVDAPNGSLAVDSGLNGPVSVAPLPDGGFLETEYNGAVVRMVSPGTPATARITTIAGTGNPGNNGSSGAAASIDLNYPTDAQPTPDGRVLIADTYNNEIRLLSAAAPGATLTTIAGGGSSCNDAATSCDGASAGSVALAYPDSVSTLTDGSGGYLISEYAANAIRMVSSLSAGGTFTTVAGTPGQAGYVGDRGPATAAQLNKPTQALSTPGGGFLIADSGNEVIRQVTGSGTITTIAGNGRAGFAGDAQAATTASFLTPMSISPTLNGGILVADLDNGLVREITVPPHSTITLNPPAPNGRNGWYVTDPSAAVSTTERATISCELDPPQAPPAFAAITPGCPYTGAGATIKGNGPHTLYAAGENTFLDQELPVSASFNVDVGSPRIMCATPPSFAYGTAAARVTAILSDPVAGPAAQVLSRRVSTTSLGQRIARLSGRNNAGTAGSADCMYTVTPLQLSPSPSAGWTFVSNRGYTTVKRLSLNDVPGGAAVSVSCAGVGCPFTHRRVGPGVRCPRRACGGPGSRPRTVVLGGLFANALLSPGTLLNLSVTEPHSVGRVVVFRIRARQTPLSTTACLAPGSQTTRYTCAPPPRPSKHG